MNWAEQKAKMKDTVHSTFALPALYTRKAGSNAGMDPFPIGARLNNDVRTNGGNSGQGFAQIIQDVPKLRLDSTVMALNGGRPEVDDLISIPSEGQTYRISDVKPMDGKFYVVEVENEGGFDV